MASHPTENFEGTLQQLKLFQSMPIENDRDRAGIIQAFEFTFEQSWLSIQKIAGALGLRAPSPKQAFSVAMAQGWIKSKDESKWLRMLEDRNLTSHTYKQAIANEVLNRISSDYIPLFEDLLAQLKNAQ